MNDTDLNRILKGVSTPPRSADYWADFPERVTRNLNRPRTCFERRSWFPRLAWAGGFALACIIAAFVCGRRVGHDEAARDPWLRNEKFVREVVGTFPNRVRAIIDNGSGLQLVLSEHEDVPESMPIWLRVCQGGRCTSCVTFSGQEVVVAGLRMTVLADSENGVILAGDRFAWTSKDSKSGLPNLKIQAQPIQFAAR